MNAETPPTDKPKRGKIINLADARAEGWLNELQRSDRGFKGNDYNVTVALQHAPELGGKIGWDVRQLAYSALTETPAGAAGRWTDSHTAKLAVWLQKLGLPVTMRHVETGLAAVVRSLEVDPLGEYLNDLPWDGHERIGTWLHDYCGADASDANSIMGSKFLIGAVARALRPGCQMDNMLVLEGDQGMRKSSAIKILGGEWSGENIPDFHSKDAMQIIGTKWITEVGEMAATRRSDIQHLNAFVTRREDTFRPPYGRHPITVPRWSVLIGNYNPDGTGVLEDPTGARRFWIVAVRAIDTDALTKDRDQLWAEAVFCYKRGDPWWLTSDDENLPVAAQQSARRDNDAWLPAIDKYVTVEPFTGSPRPSHLEPITTWEVLEKAIGMSVKDIERRDQMRAGKCLREIGYHRSKKWGKGAQSNVYVWLPED